MTSTSLKPVEEVGVAKCVCDSGGGCGKAITTLGDGQSATCIDGSEGHR